MRYQNNANDQAAVTAALTSWYGRACHAQLYSGAWLQLHPGGTVFYNCGGVANGGGYGLDYVDDDLYDWLTGHLPQNFVFAGGPTTAPGGNWDLNGNPEFIRDYYTITRLVRQKYDLPKIGKIPKGTYKLVLNFHLYVGDWEDNRAYVVPPPPPPPALPPPPLDRNSLSMFPPLG